MFVPLTEYHGGGEQATIEPLSRYWKHYQTMLWSNLGAGVQAVYRGHRLFDSDHVREGVGSAQFNGSSQIVIFWKATSFILSLTG